MTKFSKGWGGSKGSNGKSGNPFTKEKTLALAPTSPKGKTAPSIVTSNMKKKKSQSGFMNALGKM